jgi:ribonuclease P protein component
VTVIVDKKVSKLAVERNLVKRRLRAILAANSLPNGSTIVRGFSGVETMSYEQLSSSLQQCLKKLSHKK